MSSAVKIKGVTEGCFANFIGLPGVLFIDDEPEVLASLRRAFRHVRELAVFTTGDPEEALELIRLEQIYLIITDQNMPGIMGTDLLRKVKDIAPHVKLGILTAYADLKMFQESVNDIRVSYLFMKPYDSRELVQKVLAAVQDVEHTIRDQMEQLRTRKRNYELESINQDLINLSLQRNKIMNNIEHGYKALLKIGKLLGKEKDEETLLRLILHTAREMTGADAGSIYILEDSGEEEECRMRIKYSYTYSKNLPFEETVLPVNSTSVAGHVFLKGKTLNIPDVRDMPATVPFSFNPSFDEKYDYHTRSMLLLPMHDQNDRVIGVIQLINRKAELSNSPSGKPNDRERRLESAADFNRYVHSFKEDSVPFMEALAGQAGITIERNRLLYQIEKLFEGFVRSSVEAIESRDSATVGHSFRVAGHCLRMAEKINTMETGPYAKVFFDENRMKRLEYSALLHDFGKLFIDPKVLLKEKKILPEEMQQIEERFVYMYRYQELIHVQQKLQLIKSLLHLQAERLFENEKRVLLEASRRVEAISCVIESSYARWVGSEIDFRHIVTIIKQNHEFGEFVGSYECSFQLANRWVPLDKAIYLSLIVNEFFNISGKIKKTFLGGPHKMYLSFRYEEAEEKYYIEFFHTALTKYLDLKDVEENQVTMLLVRTLGESQLRGTLQLPVPHSDPHSDRIVITIPSKCSFPEKSKLMTAVPSLLR